MMEKFFDEKKIKKTLNGDSFSRYLSIKS